MTLLSRVSGYIRDLAIAFLLGTSLATDAFVVAIRLPAMLGMLTTRGGLAAAFIPVFTSWREEHGEQESWEFARRLFWTAGLIVFGIMLVGIALAPQLVQLFTFMSPKGTDWSLAVLLTRITLPFVLATSLMTVAAVALNSVGVFGLPAAVGVFLNLSIITAGGVAWFRGVEGIAVYLAIGFVIGGFVQFLVLLPPLARRGMPFGFRVDFHHPAIRKIWILMLPALTGVGIYQFNVLVSTAFASTSEGWMAALFFANRISDLVLGVVVISVATVALPALSELAAKGQMDEMQAMLGFALRNINFIVIPAAMGLVVFRVPIVRVLFQHKAFDSASTDLTSWPLLFYALGLPAVSWVRILVQGFFALQDTRTPVLGAALALVANATFCAVLVTPLGQGGLALATTIASFMNLTLIYWLYRRKAGRLDEARLLVSFLKAGISAAVMYAVCWGLLGTSLLNGTPEFWMQVVGLLVSILIGGVVYLGAAWMLRTEEIRGFVQLMSGHRIAMESATSTEVGSDLKERE